MNEFDNQEQPSRMSLRQRLGSLPLLKPIRTVAASRFFRGLHRGSSTASRSARWFLVFFLLLVAFPIGAVIAGYVARPAPGTMGISSSSPSPSSSNHLASGGIISKPAPGRPMLRGAQLPPPSMPVPSPIPEEPLQQVPLTTPQPQQPNAGPGSTNPAIAANNPPPPVAGPKQAFAPVVYTARHDKHFGQGCSGQLTLNSSGLQFNCPEDPQGSVEVALNQIDSVDDNGIRLTSGKKYHFSIPGMTKNAEQALFTEWFSRVR